MGKARNDCPQHDRQQPLKKQIKRNKDRHRQYYTSQGRRLALEIIHVRRDRFATTFGRKHKLELPWARSQEVRRTILIAECVAADDDGLDPFWDGSRNVLKDVADLREQERKPPQSKGKWGDWHRRVLTVPLGEYHIPSNLNSFVWFSSGVMAAHLMPTLYLRTASAESTVT